MEKILDLALTVNKSDIKSHKSIKFNVDKEAEILKIEFDYLPRVAKELGDIIYAFENRSSNLSHEEISSLKEKFIRGEEELKNLATLSLYYNNKYIGCAHRHIGKQTIIISSKESTAGFINAPIKTGLWEIVISLHGVFTDNMKIFVNAFIE
ncbi:hypothetical protein [Clostridium pasteurianum]|uniref:hypothetical protein n=1 Tax=Clostridium pasteurianum TaxID=1501 RepID=UPI0003A28E02|nr:hypothetical protein [Clostridium pasteurianum]